MPKRIPLLSVVLLAFLLIGTSLQAAPKQIQLTITYATGDPLTKQLTHDAIAAFMKANPQIKLLEDLTAGTTGYADTLKVKDAVGEFPDIIEMRDAPMFVRAGKLAPLPRELHGLFESLIPIYSTVYTAPITAQYPNGIIYNRKVFKANGWNENPKNYAEFLQLCEKIKAKGTAPIVAGVKDIWHLGFWFGKFWVDNIGTKNPNWIADRYAGKVHFTDADFAAGIRQMVELFAKGYVEAGFMSTTEAQCPMILTSGKAAMYYSGTFTFKQIMDADPGFELGWFPVPDNAGKVKLLGGPTSMGWALSAATAKDPEKTAAFVKFVKFFFAKKQYTVFVSSMNGFPTTKQKITYEATTPAMQTVLKIFPKAPKSLNWNNGVGANELPPPFRNWAYKKLQEAILGTISVDQALKEMDAEFDRLSKDFNPSEFKPVKLNP